ncbi:MAG: hypothetical protein QXQ70_04145 [Candidatus Caldarchaeum sp.]
MERAVQMVKDRTENFDHFPCRRKEYMAKPIPPVQPETISITHSIKGVIEMA